MKIFNLIFCIGFVVYAGLQYNDPEPYIWIPVFLYGAVLCWFAFRGQYYSRIYLISLALLAIFAGYKVFEPDGLLDWMGQPNTVAVDGSNSAKKTWTREVREFFGLAAMIIVLLIDYIYAVMKRLP